MAKGKGADPTRGSGAGKTTVAEEPQLEAGPATLNNEDAGNAVPDPARGGCMRFGWGCLPILAVAAALPSMPLLW